MKCEFVNSIVQGARITLGIILIVASAAKALSRDGTAQLMTVAKSFVPRHGKATGIMFLVTEAITGIWMVSGVQPVLSGAVFIVLIGGATVATTYARPLIDRECACFGVLGGQLTAKQQLARNTGLVAIAIAFVGAERFTICGQAFVGYVNGPSLVIGLGGAVAIIGSQLAISEWNAVATNGTVEGE